MTDEQLVEMLAEADQQPQCEVQSDRNVRVLVAEVRRLRAALADLLDMARAIDALDAESIAFDRSALLARIHEALEGE
jgi:hypothetical protein